MLIFHHSSKTNELRNIQGSGQQTRSTESKSTKSKQRNGNDDRYLILQLLEPGNTGYQLAPYLPGTSWLVGRICLVGRIDCKSI